jgi:hypothetical protein
MARLVAPTDPFAADFAHRRMVKKSPWMGNFRGFLYIVGAHYPGVPYRIKAGTAGCPKNLIKRLQAGCRTVHKTPPHPHLRFFAASVRVPRHEAYEAVLHSVLGEAADVIDRILVHRKGCTEVWQDSDPANPVLTAQYCAKVLERISVAAWAYEYQEPQRVVFHATKPLGWPPAQPPNFRNPSREFTAWLCRQVCASDGSRSTASSQPFACTEPSFSTKLFFTAHGTLWSYMLP